MSLDLAGLQDDIEALAAAPGETIAECAQAWADAMQSYASGIVPPSTTINAASATLATALAAAFASPSAAPLMETAFMAFATAVGLGMAPTFTGAPPPSPVGFALQFAGPKPTTHEQAGQQIGALIDTWMKTGTATLVAPPNTVTPWS